MNNYFKALSMNKLALTQDEMLLAERIAAYYRQPERTSYCDK